ncbi:MAG: MFS transporter [Pseudomonadota bacterium]
MKEFGEETGAADIAPARGLSPFSGGTPRSWFSLAILLLVGLYMFMDRQVITLQVEGITGDLGLSDFQFGLIQGLSIALFAAVVGYPIAWVSDLVDRRFVIAVAVLVWSLAVVGCGLSANFTQLFLSSAIVGAGEAALLPITYALIPLLFRGQSRYTANSTLVLASRLGSGGIMVLCGLIVLFAERLAPTLPGALSGMEPWRISLFLTALPGPILALMVFLIPKDRKAGPVEELASAAAVDVSHDIRDGSAIVFLKDNLLSFLTFYAGVGLIVFSTSAMGAFIPVVAIRTFGASPVEVGAGFGTATLIAALTAMVVSVSVSSLLMRRYGARTSIMVILITALGGAMVVPLFLFVETTFQIYLLVGIGFTFTMIGTMVFPTAIQDMCPAPSRTRLISIIIVVNLALSAASPPLVGLISDRLGADGQGLLPAIVLVATAGFLLSALSLAACARFFPRTVRQARRIEDEGHVATGIRPIPAAPA